MGRLAFGRSSALRRILAGLALSGLAAGSALAERACPAEQPVALVPTDPDLCRQLDPVVRDPSGLPLGQYEQKLRQYFNAFCHRAGETGWVRDKFVRDTGPYVSTRTDAGWTGRYFGTHAPVVIWYSPEMADWVRANRAAEDEHAAEDAEPVPDGAMIVKEMYPKPASLCADVDPNMLLPTSGAAIMIRDSEASHDGWFWGWYGWNGWSPDWPADNDENRLAYMGFAAYCMNCHASARDNLTFSSSKNMQGEPGRPLVFLSQDEDPVGDRSGQHASVVLPKDDAGRLGQPHVTYDDAFLGAYPWTDPAGTGAPPPSFATVSKMPSETYDEVVRVPAGHPGVSAQYLPSAQCIGCHDAGGTGLQFDMTVPDPASGKLWNHSPYATWRTSPMGLAGRDPIFFAQLASELQTFHPDLDQQDGTRGLVQNTCLGCHGILGQRQYQIDHAQTAGSGGGQTPDCGIFRRELANAVPWPADNPDAADAGYGALARDGISCTSCHRMVLGADEEAVAAAPQNACVLQRQKLLNPGHDAFAKTFTGSFLVGPPDELYGPFEDPKTAPMATALGNVPQHNTTIASSETCGTCHTVHLPVFHEGRKVGQVYEQTTYAEWAFSAYRTGTSPYGDLPAGAGDRAQSCQDCHMPSTEPDGTKTRSKIASIQEYSNFPQAEFAKPPEEIDLPIRTGFARHTLVGLNVFLTKMAQQFPDVLGIRTQDPMLTTSGVDPLIYTEQQMLDQAAHATAGLSVDSLKLDGDTLRARVTVSNRTGHKFPSGVGFRRAFLQFEVLDRLGRTIWASGRTDGAGRLIGGDGEPLPGELWWGADCSARIAPLERRHQKHHQTITRQSQAQIYQELVSTPPPEGPVQCGHEADPAGQLTTSFLSICAEVKDNRLLPHGFLDAATRVAIAETLGAGAELGEDVAPLAVDGDPDYADGSGGGKDTLIYEVPVNEIDGEPVHVRVRMYFQATPPFYLQDRFCTAQGADRDRLYFLSGHLKLDGTAADSWKLQVADTGMVALPGL